LLLPSNFKRIQLPNDYNPSQFCLPFYLSFHAIIFNKQEVKEEVDRYLAEVKSAIKGSKNKELLFEAVENLAEALNEVQNSANLDFQGMKGELNFYRKYCDRAAELMKDTDEKAPFATEVLRKGLPLLDRNLKGLIEEIQKKANAACQVSQGTATQEIACVVNKEIQKWEIGSQEFLLAQIENLVNLLKFYIPKIEENIPIRNRVDSILLEPYIVKQYMLLNNLFPQIINIQVSNKTDSISNEIKHLQDSVDRLTVSIDELQNPQEYLDKIQSNLEEIKNEIPEMKEKIDEVLYELYSPLSTDQKLKIAIPIIPALVSYEIETNVPKLVADKIDELKNLVLCFKKNSK
jgi:methyl-accepting chemotaxis protein